MNIPFQPHMNMEAELAQTRVQLQAAQNTVAYLLDNLVTAKYDHANKAQSMEERFQAMGQENQELRAELNAINQKLNEKRLVIQMLYACGQFQRHSKSPLKTCQTSSIPPATRREAANLLSLLDLDDEPSDQYSPLTPETSSLEPSFTNSLDQTRDNKPKASPADTREKPSFIHYFNTSETQVKEKVREQEPLAKGENHDTTDLCLPDFMNHNRTPMTTTSLVKSYHSGNSLIPQNAQDDAILAPLLRSRWQPYSFPQPTQPIQRVDANPCVVSTAFSIGHKPDPNEHDQYRTVIIDALPSDISLYDVMKKVCGGLIISSELLDTRTINHGMTVRIVFLKQSSAQAFTDYASDHPLLFSDTKARITHLRSSPTKSLSAATRHAVEQFERTRCLRFLGVPRGSDNLVTLRGSLAPSSSSYKRDRIQAIESCGNSVVAVFDTVEAAMLGYRLISSEFNHYSISSSADPCDILPSLISPSAMADAC